MNNKNIQDKNRGNIGQQPGQKQGQSGQQSGQKQGQQSGQAGQQGQRGMQNPTGNAADYENE